MRNEKSSRAGRLLKRKANLPKAGPGRMDSASRNPLSKTEGEYLTSENEYVDDDAEDMSRTDKLLVTILSRGSSKGTKVQKLGLLINAVLEGKAPKSHGAYFFGGFSDELEASESQLAEDGIVRNRNKDYSLTNYGREVKKCLESKKDPEYAKIKEAAEPILDTFWNLDDQAILDLTYYLFPELSENSMIRESVERRIEHRRIRGVTTYRLKKEDLPKLERMVSEAH